MPGKNDVFLMFQKPEHDSKPYAAVLAQSELSDRSALPSSSVVI
jgi:hypothetical protein